MIKLGIYKTENGDWFDCEFFPEEKCAIAIGPLPKEGVGSRGIKAEVYAESEEEAKTKLRSALGEGTF